MKNHPHQSIRTLQVGRDEINVADNCAGTHVLQLVVHRRATDLKLRFVHCISFHVLWKKPFAGIGQGLVAREVEAAGEDGVPRKRCVANVPCKTTCLGPDKSVSIGMCTRAHVWVDSLGLPYSPRVEANDIIVFADLAVLGLSTQHRIGKSARHTRDCRRCPALATNPFPDPPATPG